MTADEEAFRNQAALVLVLRKCILAPSFHLTPKWTSGLVLTDLGRSLFETIRAVDTQLPLNAIHFACFLEERLPLIEPSHDLSGVKEAIEESMNNQTLFLANNLSREFHDSLIKHYSDREGPLSNLQSIEVLRDVSQGVFHAGPYLFGPLGIFELPHLRALLPSTELPAYYCDNEACFDIHKIRLETDQDADINKAIVEMGRAISVARPQPDLDRLNAIRDWITSSQRTEPLFDLLSDGFSESELAILVEYLYQESQPEDKTLMRSMASLQTGPFQEFIASAPRGVLLQLVLVKPDVVIEEALDDLARTREIKLKEYEVRRPRISNRWTNQRTPVAELSSSGFRRQTGGGSPARNLMKLVHELYFTGTAATPEDLAYNIDAPLTGSVDSLLTTALRLGDAEEVISRVLLADRRLNRDVCHRLGLDEVSGGSRDELVKAILWKIGGEVPIRFDEVDSAEESIQNLKSALAAGSGKSELRGITANLFNSMELAVRRCLSFATWALGTDHTNSSVGFSYDPDLSSEILAFIEDRTSTQASYRMNPAGLNTFAPLAAGFSRLADALDACNQVPADDRRDSTGDGSDSDTFRPTLSPVGASRRPQVFKRGPAYLSILPESQLALQGTLKNMSSVLGDSKTVAVRNAVIHTEHDFPSNSDFLSAISSIEAWVKLALSSGLFPIPSKQVRQDRDALGRSETLYSSQVGEQVVFDPQWHDSNRMPLNHKTLIFVPMAVLPAVGALRFKVRTEGNEAAWSDFPHRIRTTSG